MKNMQAGIAATGLMALGLMVSLTGPAPAQVAPGTPAGNPIRAARDVPSEEVLVVPDGLLVDVSAALIRVPTVGQIGWPYDRGPLERQRGSQPVFLTERGPRISELWAKGFVRINVSNGTNLRPASPTGWVRITLESYGPDERRVWWQPMPAPQSAK